MKSYTYKLVNWDNCPDVRVNIDVSQDLWQPYFWLRLRREFLSGNQSVLSFFVSFLFSLFLFADYLTAWRWLSTLQHTKHEGWIFLFPVLVCNENKDPENRLLRIQQKTWFLQRTFAHLPLSFVFLILSVHKQLYCKSLQFEEIVFFYFVQYYPPKKPNQKQTQNKILTFSVSFFYVTIFVPEKCE